MYHPKLDWGFWRPTVSAHSFSDPIFGKLHLCNLQTALYGLKGTRNAFCCISCAALLKVILLEQDKEKLMIYTKVDWWEWSNKGSKSNAATAPMRPLTQQKETYALRMPEVAWGPHDGRKEGKEKRPCMIWRCVWGSVVCARHMWTQGVLSENSSYLWFMPLTPCLCPYFYWWLEMRLRLPVFMLSAVLVLYPGFVSFSSSTIR